MKHVRQWHEKKDGNTATVTHSSSCLNWSTDTTGGRTCLGHLRWSYV